MVCLGFAGDAKIDGVSVPLPSLLSSALFLSTSIQAGFPAPEMSKRFDWLHSSSPCYFIGGCCGPSCMPSAQFYRHMEVCLSSALRPVRYICWSCSAGMRVLLVDLFFVSNISISGQLPRLQAVCAASTGTSTTKRYDTSARDLDCLF